RAAAAPAAPVAGEDDAGRKPAATHGHGHPKPAAPRSDDRAAKPKGARGSHQAPAGGEDDDSAARFAGKMHLSAADRARRSTARPKARPQRGNNRDQSRTGTGFTRPIAP